LTRNDCKSEDDKSQEQNEQTEGSEPGAPTQVGSGWIPLITIPRGDAPPVYERIDGGNKAYDWKEAKHSGYEDSE
jgi:hypothetical protein